MRGQGPQEQEGRMLSGAGSTGLDLRTPSTISWPNYFSKEARAPQCHTRSTVPETNKDPQAWNRDPAFCEIGTPAAKIGTQNKALWNLTH